MYEILEKTLDQLETLVKENPKKYRFNSPADKEKIQEFEKTSDMKIPDSYKKFLLRFNGGYICEESLTDISKDSAKWNSNYLNSIEELSGKYWDLRDKGWKMYDYEYLYPFIPFCHTKMQELLIFVSAFLPIIESPVFDAFHEEPVSEWGVVYEDFEDFLEDYVKKDGDVELISKSNYPSAYGWIDWTELKEYWEEMN